jgi:hypothetical protein
MSPLMAAIMAEFGPSRGNVRAAKAVEARVVELLTKLFASAVEAARKEYPQDRDKQMYFFEGWIRAGVASFLGKDSAELPSVHRAEVR